jgi:hypothetical protein
MSLSSTQTLKDRTNADRTFLETSRDGQGASRLDSATTLAEPARLEIKHSTSGKGSAAVDRHLIQVTRTKLNSTTGEPVRSSINLTINVPRDSTITSNMIEDDISALIRFIAGTNYDPTADYSNTTLLALMRGES